MKNKAELGKEGEKIAADYLKARGYKLLETNWRFKRSEIDLICRKDDLLVFVEVKTRSSIGFGQPEESVDEKKVAKVVEGAEAYIFQNDWNMDIRFDIVSIVIKEGRQKILHLEDAFY
ncbi:MAG: YraN family protein [Bacteroidota bacterium]